MPQIAGQETDTLPDLSIENIVCTPVGAAPDIISFNIVNSGGDTVSNSVEYLASLAGFGYLIVVGLPW